MARLSCIFALISCAAVVSVGAPARAEPEPSRQPMTWNASPVGANQGKTDSSDQPAPPPDDASRATDDGRLLPFTMGAVIPQAHAGVTALAGYDSAARSGRAITAAEARALKFLALRVEYEHGPGTGSDDRVSLGARVAILRQAAHGIDLGAGVFFQPKDFRGEGSFVGAVLLGRNFGRWGLFCNGLVAVDSEGDDFSTELRLSSMYRVNNLLHIGFDARGHYNFSDDEKRFSAQQVNWELQAGPLASMTLGPVALLAIVGPSALHLTEASSEQRTAVGVLAMAGAGAAF